MVGLQAYVSFSPVVIVRRVQTIFAIAGVLPNDHLILLVRKLSDHGQQERPGVQRFVEKVVAFAVHEAREDAVPGLAYVPATVLALQADEDLKGFGKNHDVRGDQTVVVEEFQGIH